MKSEITIPIQVDFKNSRDSLRIYDGAECIFRSDKNDLSPLLEYISSLKTIRSPVRILDKVMGNAAALLSVKAGATEVYSPLGSELAEQTLRENHIEQYLEKRVPFILARNGRDMCPMEKLSQNKSPDQFLEALKVICGRRNQ
jgi:hypothetical protein